MKGFLSVLLVCILAMSGSMMAYGATSNNVYDEDAQLRPDFRIIIDGVECRFENAAGDQIFPILCEGSTYLPVRSIGEIMGKNVNWDEANKTITLSENNKSTLKKHQNNTNLKRKDVNIQVRGDFKIIIDGQTCTFKNENSQKTSPILYNGSTYLPIRAIGEIMGKKVAWDNTNKIVTLEGNAKDLTVTDADSFTNNTNNANNGTNNNNNDKPSQGNDIGAKKAKEIAAKDAGLDVNKVNFIKASADIDDGRKVYELEFTYSNKKYEYDIDARNGNIISKETDKIDDDHDR